MQRVRCECGCAGRPGEGDWADCEPSHGQAPQGGHHTLSGQTPYSAQADIMLCVLSVLCSKSVSQGMNGVMGLCSSS